MVGAVSGNAGQVLQVVFSSVGLFIALIAALVVGILVYRGRRKPGSRMRAVIDAGFLAIPGLVAVIAGVVGLFVGIAYFLILFVYWLFYFIVASIWVAIVGGQVTYPAEFGQIAGQGFIYLGLGLLISILGVGWLALVIARAVRIAQRRLRATTYTVSSQPTPVAALPSGPPLGPPPGPPPSPIPPAPPPLEPVPPAPEPLASAPNPPPAMPRRSRPKKTVQPPAKPRPKPAPRTRRRDQGS
ncbi:MAG TPA: hypothetical protein VG329_10025 [Candidatus Dormibacteraeota bacterium]|nr:hypothetical protein [Candidatus Dormibacteraeota bacterium]